MLDSHTCLQRIQDLSAFRSATRLTRLVAAAGFTLLLSFGPSASALQIVYEGFNYAAGELNGQTGGSGDWKDPWSGDSGIHVLSGGSSYTDSNLDTLEVEGNHVGLDSDPGSILLTNRTLNTPLGTGTTADSTLWFSALFDGTSSSEVLNIGLGDGVFFGQGGKDFGGTTWALYDNGGLIGDTFISSDASAFLVVRVDFDSSGDETAWLWVDPVLVTEPGTGSADATGTAVSFSFDFIRMQLESFGDSSLDEIRVGDSYVDVAPITLAPEPSTFVLVMLGMIGLAARSRDRESA